MGDDDNNAIHFILLLNRSNLIDFKSLHTDQTETTVKKNVEFTCWCSFSHMLHMARIQLKIRKQQPSKWNGIQFYNDNGPFFRQWNVAGNLIQVEHKWNPNSGALSNQNEYWGAFFLIIASHNPEQSDSTHIVWHCNIFRDTFFHREFYAASFWQPYFTISARFNWGIWVEGSNMPASTVDILHFFQQCYWRCSFLFRGTVQINETGKYGFCENFKHSMNMKNIKRFVPRIWSENGCSKAGFY